MVSRCLAAGTVALVAGAASADEIVDGEYLCEVHQKAGIGGIHLEDAGPPQSFVEERLPTRFVMRVSGPTDSEPRYRIVEAPYSGPGRDPADWHTEHSVLHGAYLGDGHDFEATEDQGFLRLGQMLDGTHWFYHAGFEYLGGEDTFLSVRFGACEQRLP